MFRRLFVAVARRYYVWRLVRLGMNRKDVEELARWAIR